MRRLLFTWTFLVCFFLGVGKARAGMLTGAVSFDSQSGLYKYDYTVEVPVGGLAVNELVIKVDSINLFGDNGYFALPVAHTEPPGWEFLAGISDGTVGGAISTGPIQTFGAGSSWTWLAFTGLGIAPGSSGRFSFSTTQAPTTEQNVNSYLYIGYVFVDNTLNFVDVGHVVAPDFRGGTGVIGGPPVADAGPWAMCQVALWCGMVVYHGACQRKSWPSEG